MRISDWSSDVCSSDLEIVSNWLPRYTGTALEQFGEHILLTNFGHYVELFAQWHGVEVQGRDRPMPNATADGITLINFGMGSPHAATVLRSEESRVGTGRVSTFTYWW